MQLVVRLGYCIHSKKGNPELTYEEFLREGFYDKGDYIFDTNSGECIDGRVFFHKIMDQSGEDR